MDLKSIMLSEISQIEKDKYNKLVTITKKKQTHRYREQISGYLWGEGWGEGQYRQRALRGTNYQV